MRKTDTTKPSQKAAEGEEKPATLEDEVAKALASRRASMEGEAAEEEEIPADMAELEEVSAPQPQPLQQLQQLLLPPHLRPLQK